MAGRAPRPPAADVLGFEFLGYDDERREITVGFDAKPDFVNPAGVIQGGFLAAMLDDTLGPALVAELGEGEWAPTLELKVQFLRPVTPGRVTGTGRVVHLTGRVGYLAGELRNSDGDVVAAATATTMVRGRA